MGGNVSPAESEQFVSLTILVSQPISQEPLTNYLFYGSIWTTYIELVVEEV